MVAAKTKRISTLIETQLPEFISTEYELFTKFVEKYYESQEVQGGTLDVINNLQKYADIDYYEKNILRQHDTLDTSITNSSDTIVLQDATSFPKADGYVRIDDEIIFMQLELILHYKVVQEVLVVIQNLVICIMRLNLRLQLHLHMLLVKKFIMSVIYSYMHLSLIHI